MSEMKQMLNSFAAGPGGVTRNVVNRFLFKAISHNNVRNTLGRYCRTNTPSFAINANNQPFKPLAGNKRAESLVRLAIQRVNNANVILESHCRTGDSAPDDRVVTAKPRPGGLIEKHYTYPPRSHISPLWGIPNSTSFRYHLRSQILTNLRSVIQ